MPQVIPLFVAPSPYEIVLLLLIIGLLFASKYFYNMARAGKDIFEWEQFKTTYADQLTNNNTNSTSTQEEITVDKSEK